MYSGNYNSMFSLRNDHDITDRCISLNYCKAVIKIHKNTNNGKKIKAIPAANISTSQSDK